jgi:hypothetical protein
VGIRNFASISHAHRGINAGKALISFDTNVGDVAGAIGASAYYFPSI